VNEQEAFHGQISLGMVNGLHVQHGMLVTEGQAPVGIEASGITSNSKDALGTGSS
jgi:hypothetical protein